MKVNSEADYSSVSSEYNSKPLLQHIESGNSFDKQVPFKDFRMRLFDIIDESPGHEITETTWHEQQQA